MDLRQQQPTEQRCRPGRAGRRAPAAPDVARPDPVAPRSDVAARLATAGESPLARRLAAAVAMRAGLHDAGPRPQPPHGPRRRRPLDLPVAGLLPLAGPTGVACTEGGGCEATGQPFADAGVPASLPADEGPDHLTSPRFAGDETLEACYENRARLGVGAHGEPVRKVQQALIDLGYDLGSRGADSAYGKATAAAVRAFKRDEELGSEQYGDVGPGTMHRLDFLFPPPEGDPLCRSDADDVPFLADDAGSNVAAIRETGAGVQLVAFGVPGVLCQIRPALNRFGDIPEDVRKRMKVTVGTGIPAKVIDEAYKPWFGDPRDRHPKPAVQLPFTVVFGDGVPQNATMRESLGRVIFSITGAKDAPLLPMSTTTLDIGDVSDIQGQAQKGGVFRFSRFKVGKAPETALVERLGDSTQPSPANLTAGRELFELAWGQRNFKLSGPGWDAKDRVAWLHMALWRNPLKALLKFRDITFFYGPKAAGVKEDGTWDPSTKTLTLFYGVFDANAQRVGTFPYAVFVIQHELGHALEMTFDQGVLAQFSKALTADGGVPVTDYARTNAHESFAEAYALWTLDPEELQALRPKVGELFRSRYAAK